MTDTKAPSPIWDFLKGLTPSIGQALILIVTAGISAVGGIWTYSQAMKSPPPPRVVEVVKTVPDTGSTLQRLSVIEGKLDQMLADQAARKGRKAVATKAK